MLDVMYTNPASSHQWAVVDVETSGMSPSRDRILSLAVVLVNAEGAITRTMSVLLNPGVDPGPTAIHGLTTEVLAGQPEFHEVAGELAEMLAGSVFVAHNAEFDYGFVAAEAARAGIVLPVDKIMCTVDLARRLTLDVENFKLATLAKFWGVNQARPHDALDDARVLTGVLHHALCMAAESGVSLPIRSVHRLSGTVLSRSLRAA